MCQWIWIPFHSSRCPVQECLEFLFFFFYQICLFCEESLPVPFVRISSILVLHNSLHFYFSCLPSDKSSLRRIQNTQFDFFFFKILQCFKLHFRALFGILNMATYSCCSLFRRKPGNILVKASRKKLYPGANLTYFFIFWITEQ